MKRKELVIIAGVVSVALLFGLNESVSEAKTASSVLPSAGMASVLDDGILNQTATVATATRAVSSSSYLSNEKVSVEVKSQSQVASDSITTEDGTKIDYKDLVVAQVNSYVNVRSLPDADKGEVVGKLYNNSVGTLVKEENGWYEITSGNCTGWVKAEYCVSGKEAAKMVPEISTTYATVTTTTLKVRAEASSEAACIGMVPNGDDFIVVDDLGEWIQITTEDGEGFVSKEYVELNVDFVYAESKAEEEARLAKEEAERKAAQEAAAKKAAEEAAKKQAATEAAQQQAAASTSTSTTTSSAPATTYAASGSGYGTDVANYALQFVGNPYVYGGSSLTNGTDCSGFVMSVYANFGVSLPHSSKSDRSVGYEVEGGLANAQPGDLVCYSGHVALYIGNGQIVHASTSKTGIIVSNASYKTPIAVRRIF